MYFEEPWFIDFCVRLNCFQQSLMSSSDPSENLEDFEEGEIVDDDDCDVSIYDVSDVKLTFDSNSIFSKRFGSENVPSRSTDHFNEPMRSGPSHITSDTSPRGKEPSRSKPVRKASRQRNSRLGYYTKRAYNRQIPSRNSYNTYRNRRQINNVRDRSRAGTPYEEKLKDFQAKMRQQRNNLQLDSQDKLSVRTSTNRHSSGTSLLKRLVGSGSVGIKLRDDSVSEPSKCNTPLNLDDHVKDMTHAVTNIPVPGSVNNSITQSDLVNETHDYSQSTTKSHVGDTKKVLDVNEKLSYSSSDLDNELMELRMEALKTVVLKKHSERLKRGYVPKKTIKDLDDPVIDSFIEEVESLIDLDPVNVSPCDIKSDELNNVLGDYSDMSMDSNYVSDDDVPGQSIPPPDGMNIPKTANISGIKRPLSEDSVSAKKLKLDELSSDSNDVSTDNIISDLNDEELQLRALALKSFLEKKAHKDNDTDSDKVSIKSEPLDVATKEELDNTESKTELSEVKTSEEAKDLENWEELDEDILRAQLLKTLSSNLPEHSVLDEEVLDEPDSIYQNIVKSISSSKKDIDAELDKQSKLWSEMMVPKLVISLGSDSESDPESKPVDFVKSLDLLLQEAKEKSEKMSAKGVLKPKIKKKTTSPKHPLMKQLVKKGPPVTPVAVKHLPKLQQEEYRRLKMMLAEKLKRNKPKNSSKVSPATLRMQPPIPSKKLNSKQQLQKLDNTVTSKPETNVSLTQKPVTFPSKSNIKLISHQNNDSSKKQNVPIGINPSYKTCEASDVPVYITPKSQVLVNSRTKVVNKVAPVVNMKKNVPVSRETKINLTNKTIVSQPQSSSTNTILNKLTIKTDLKNSSSKTNVSVTSKVVETFQLKTNEIKSKNGVSKSDLVNLSKDNFVEAAVSNESKFDNVTDKNTVSKISGANMKNEPSDNTEIVTPIIMDKQGRLASKDKSSEVRKSVTVKDNQGNSDKENENVKDKTIFVRTEERGLEFIERSSLLESRLSSDQNLVQELREAENNYEETLTLISRLEKELEEAKKMLTERGQTVAALKELIKGPKDLATLSVKVSDGDVSNKNTIVSLPENIVKLKASNIESCWDPDGVLCPFQLAGCCKDPSCSFHHIQS